MSDALLDRLERLHHIAEQHGFGGIAARVAEMRQRAGYSKVHLLVIGEFNRGKTTFVNALIGRPLLPMDIVPTTAAIWAVERGAELGATVVCKDGPQRRIEPEALARLSADGDLCSPDVKYVRITVPELALGDDVVVIDTPGVNDINEQRCDITYGFLAHADAAVFLLDASSPVTRSESEFLQGQVLAASLDKIAFVLNKADRVDADELGDATDAARERLEELLGRAVPVVALDAARALRSPHEPDWLALRAELDQLLAGARDKAARAELASRRAAAVAADLRQRIRARLEIASLKADSLARARTQFAEDERSTRERLARFVEYCDVNGRDRLKALVARSMQDESAEFTQGLQVRLESMKGDFSAFAQRTLPFELQLFVKRWFERQRPNLERFLAEFSQVVSSEYERHFGTVFGYAGSHVANHAEAGPVRSRLHASDPNEYLPLALPAAGYLAASFLALGPFAIVGLVAGSMLGKRLRDQKVEAARQQLLAQLPTFVDEVVVQPVQTLHGSIDAWFHGLGQALNAQIEADLASRRRDLEVADGAGGAISQLTNVLEELDQLQAA